MKSIQSYSIYSSFVLSSLVLFQPVTVLAQNITNVVAQQQQWSNQVLITYDISDTEGMLDDVTVRVSNNGGKTYDIVPGPEAISGDVGRALKPSIAKKIIWDVSKDFQGLSGTSFRVQLTVNRNQQQIEAMKAQEEATVTAREQMSEQERLQEQRRQEEADRIQREKEAQKEATRKAEADREEAMRRATVTAQKSEEARAERARLAAANARATATAEVERKKLEDLAGGDVPAPQKKDDILSDITGDKDNNDSPPPKKKNDVLNDITGDK